MKVNEIFDSLSGEIDGFGGQGRPTTFIRLQGCNFSPDGCSYCDSPMAKRLCGGQELSVDDVMRSVNMPKVIITGGEPLMQCIEVIELIRKLLTKNIPTTIETNGSIQIPRDFPTPHQGAARVEYLRIVMDYKLPSSGMKQRMDPEAHYLLSSLDVIKFVIATREDYDYMKSLLVDDAYSRWDAQIAISPMLKNNELEDAQWLAQKMIEDPYLRDAQFSLQTHKLLGIR